MFVWIYAAIVIEIFSLLGFVAVARTGQMRYAFIFGFNVMFFVMLLFIWDAGALNIRGMLALVFLVIYLVEMNWLLFFHQKRTAVNKLEKNLPSKERFVMLFILTNSAGFLYSLPFYFAVNDFSPLDVIDWLAVFVFAAGTLIHFFGDLQKIRFKSRHNSEGKILDSGLWALCRHPNYFGDFLQYVGFALISHSLLGWIAPAVNFLQYRFDAIPKNEEWAAKKYGESWKTYAEKVKMFFPFIY